MENGIKWNCISYKIFDAAFLFKKNMTLRNMKFKAKLRIKQKRMQEAKNKRTIILSTPS
jgi:hypothetical protein